MANPMLKQLNQSRTPSLMQNSPIQMLSQLKQFARGMSPQQAEQIVRNKLQSGEMSQQQFESLKQQAQELSNLFK